MHLLEKNILSIYQEKGKDWIASLPKRVQELADLWGLDALQPFSNLSYNYVLEGYQKETPVVLKITLNELALSREVQCLAAFSNYGAATVLNHTNDALLIQKAIPGKILKTYFPKGDQNAIKTSCEVMKKLHQAPLPKEHNFPHIQDWLALLDQEWDIPSSYLQQARKLKTNLLAQQTDLVLLHGDLHQENVISNGDDWLVIDPKGVIGYPINEIWSFVEDPQKDLLFIAEYFNFPFLHVVQWYYVHLVLAACWQIEGHLDPKLFLDLADIACSMMI